MTSRPTSVRAAAALALLAGIASTAHADDTAALAAAAREPGAVVSASGVVFKSLKAGSGASPKVTDVVKVNYRGTFPNGREFDASHGGPISLPLNGVIACWTEGLQKLNVGGKAKLTCPSGTAYGPGGAGSLIPPDATLVFEVELLGIN